MNTTRWTVRQRPIRILAPMEDVTDTVFRRIVGVLGRPDVFFTEFTGASAMFGPRADRVRGRLVATRWERPLVAQIWGNSAEDYVRAAAWLRQRGFAGVDINMGCPKPKIRKKGYCSALIEKPSLASELILAAKEGAGDLPVSVKTRIGISSIATEEWIGFLLGFGLDALTVHGRTAEDMSQTPCRWDEIGKAVTLRDTISPRTALIGNGDIGSLAELNAAYRRYGVDGVMVGRGVLANLSLFSGRDFMETPLVERLQWMRRHIALHRYVWGTSRRYDIVKKFVSVYLGKPSDYESFVERFMGTSDYSEGLELIDREVGALRQRVARESHASADRTRGGYDPRSDIRSRDNYGVDVQ